MEVLEQAAAAVSTLLAVEAPSEGELLLTFEAGRVRMRGDPVSAELVAELVVAGETRVSRGVDLGDKEPWWRLLGSPLVRAQSIPGGAALQFRHDNVRVIEVVFEAGQLRVGLLPFESAQP